MIYAERVGSRIELNATYRYKDLVQAIPGSHFESPPPTWFLPLTWAACKQARGTFGRELEVGPELEKWAVAELERRINPSLALRDECCLTADKLIVKPPNGLELREFQIADVLWMDAAESSILMNVVGSGKTISALTWMRQRVLERVLIICPAPMKVVWAAEAMKWYPEIDPIVVAGTASQRRDQIEEVASYGGMAIMNFESLRTHSRLAPYGQVRLTDVEKQPKELNFIQWDLVVVDEAHRMADPKAKQTRAAWAVGQGAKQRLAVTATPVTKGLDTLWSVLHFVDPVEWPSRTKFIDRYCDVTLNFWGGITVGAVRPEHEREFMDIFEPRSRRLPREIVLPQLPPFVRIRRDVYMSDKQAVAYRQMTERLLAQVQDDQFIVTTSTVGQLTRLGQFASSYARVEQKEDGTESVELALPSSKIDALLDDLADWLPSGEAIIVFATSRRLIELLSVVLTTKKITHSKIVGGQKEMERYEQIQAFQNGDVDVILVVIAAGGVGITLSRGRIMAFLQRSYSRVDDLQAEGRGYRMGSEIHDSVMRVDYIAPNTLEVGMLDILAMKDETLQAVVRDKETLARLLAGQHIEATLKLEATA